MPYYVAQLGGPIVRYSRAVDAIWHAMRVIGVGVRAGAVHPPCYRLARQVTAGCPERDQLCEAQAIHAWIRAHIRYVPDPPDVDMMAGPCETLAAGAGDCDDLTLLFGSLTRSIGLEFRFIVGVFDASPVPSHVLPGVMIPGKGTVPAELSGEVPFGRLPPGFRVLGSYRVDDGDLVALDYQGV